MDAVEDSALQDILRLPPVHTPYEDRVLDAL